MSQQKDKKMCTVIDSWIDEGIQTGTLNTNTTAIINLMNNLNFTAKQAMDALNIPTRERAKYRKLLAQQKAE